MIRKPIHDEKLVQVALGQASPADEAYVRLAVARDPELAQRLNLWQNVAKTAHTGRASNRRVAIATMERVRGIAEGSVRRSDNTRRVGPARFGWRMAAGITAAATIVLVASGLFLVERPVSENPRTPRKLEKPFPERIAIAPSETAVPLREAIKRIPAGGKIEIADRVIHGPIRITKRMTLTAKSEPVSTGHP